MEDNRISIEKFEYDEIVHNCIMLNLLLSAIRRNLRSGYSRNSLTILDSFTEDFALLFPDIYKAELKRLTEGDDDV